MSLSRTTKNAIIPSPMRILAIETSCDETAVSILECSGTTTDLAFNVLGTGLYSQAKKHAEFGGVYPNLAKREHQKNLIPMLELAFKESGIQNTGSGGIQNSKFQILDSILAREPELLVQLKDFLTKNPYPPKIDAIAVTQGPGLEPALWVGLNFAKALSLAWNVPLIPVNHMEGHILSVLAENGKENPKTKSQNPKIDFPAIALLISGGHTELVLVEDWLTYERIGETRDDAVGEAFDKVARLLDLPYPGGPEISRLATESRSKNLESRKSENKKDSKFHIPYSIHLPRPMIGTDDYDFSFSGLKTAVLYEVKKQETLSDAHKREIAREFEDAATEVLASKTKRALEDHGAQTLIVGGGVIANTHIREALSKVASDVGTKIFLPSRELSTDNAVMIGIAGFLNYIKTPGAYGVYDPVQPLVAKGTLRIGA